MSTAASKRRALVLGGSGAVGSAVVRALAAAGVPAEFTYYKGEARAMALAAEIDQRAHGCDLRDTAAIVALFDELAANGRAPDVLVHAAGVLRTESLADSSDAAWDDAQALSCRSALVACRELCRRIAGNGGDVVLVGALDRGQSLPLPVGFAATQGMLAAMAMAMAKELGPRNIRVNVVALGLLDQGLSIALDPEIRERYLAFSALRRFGTTTEAARAIAFWALENRYVSGKVIAVNGGI